MAGVSKLLPTYIFVCPDGNSCDNDLKNQRHCHEARGDSGTARPLIRDYIRRLL